MKREHRAGSQRYWATEEGSCTEHATDATQSTDSHVQARSYPTDKRGQQMFRTEEGFITSIWSRMTWGSRAHLGAPRKEMQRLP